MSVANNAVIDLRQEKINEVFDQLVLTFGLTTAASIHKTLIHGGKITADVREKVRRACVGSQGVQQALH